MAKNTSIIMGDHFEDFVGNQVAKGRYSNTSEVVRAGLRMLENEELKIEAIRNALIEGEDSGIGTRTMDEIFEAAQQEFAQRNG